jgi:hypothetical protein
VGSHCQPAVPRQNSYSVNSLRFGGLETDSV